MLTTSAVESTLDAPTFVERRSTRRFISLQPRLPFTPLALEDVLDEVRRAEFAHLTGDARVAFFVDGPLACARGGVRSPLLVRLHDVLNVPETPGLIFSALFKSALLELDARLAGGAPAGVSLLARELEILPEREGVRARLIGRYGLVLRHEPATLLASATVDVGWEGILAARMTPV